MASPEGEIPIWEYPIWIDDNGLLCCNSQQLVNHLKNNSLFNESDAPHFAAALESYLQSRKLDKDFLFQLSTTEFSNPQLMIFQVIIQCMRPDHVPQLFTGNDEHGRTALDILVTNNADMLTFILKVVGSSQAYETMKTKNCTGGTALHTACSHDNPTVMWIIKEHITPEEWYQLLKEEDDNSRTPLTHALINFQKKSIKMILQSLTEEQNYELLKLFNTSYHVPLLHHVILAGRGDIMKHIKQNVTSEHWFQLLSVTDDYLGRTAYMHVTVDGDIDTLKLLNAPLDARQRMKLLKSKDKTGKNSLQWAAFHGKSEIITVLLESISVDQIYDLLMLQPKSKSDITPLQWAISGNHPTIVTLFLSFFHNAPEKNHLKRLLQARDDNGRTILIWAVQKGNSETVQALLDTISASKLQKKLLFMTDDAGQTVLHCAAYRGNADIVRVINDNLKIKTPTEDNYWLMLMKRQDCLGISALLLAILQGHTDIVNLIKELVPVKVWVDLLLMKDDSGSTCLLVACWQNKSTLLNLLLSSFDGITLDERYRVLSACDSNGWTLLHWVVQTLQPEIVQTIQGLVTEDQWFHLLKIGAKNGLTVWQLAEQLLQKAKLSSNLRQEGRVDIDDFKSPYFPRESIENTSKGKYTETASRCDQDDHQHKSSGKVYFELFYLPLTLNSTDVFMQKVIVTNFPKEELTWNDCFCLSS